MKLFLTLLILIPIFTFSQEPLTFSEVIEQQGVSKEELYIRGREWFNENFKSSKDVLQISDKETGELLGKGYMEVVYIFRYMGERKFPTDVYFQVNLWVKDGKYKYEMTNFDVRGNSVSIEMGLITTSNETNKRYGGYSKSRMNDMYFSIKKGTEAQANLLIADLKLKMANKSKSTNW